MIIAVNKTKKELYGYFKRQTKEIALEMTWTEKMNFFKLQYKIILYHFKTKIDNFLPMIAFIIEFGGARGEWSYLPTPPLGQDMTQGQILSGVQQVLIQGFPSPRLVA